MNLGPAVAVLLVVVVIALARALSVSWRRRPEVGLQSRVALPTDGATGALDRETRLVVGWLLDQAFEQTGARLADDKMAYDRIVAAARKATTDLKTLEAATISLPFLTADASGPRHVECRLTREALRGMTRA